MGLFIIVLFTIYLVGPTSRALWPNRPVIEAQNLHTVAGEDGVNRESGKRSAMDKSPEAAPAAAAAEVADRFRALVDADDISAIRQTQHLM